MPFLVPFQVAALSVLSLGGPIPKIVGGEVVPPGGWPTVGALLLRDGSICTGTLIDQDTLLTAGHCFLFSDPRHVYFGDAMFSGEGLTVATTQFNVHPQFCGQTECRDEAYDFAYVDLETSPGLAPSPLLLTQDEWDATMYAGATVDLVGFGVSEPGSSDVDGVKRQVTTTITHFSPQALQLRAGADGKDSCNGDSGGPAFVVGSSGPLLAGVLSEGSDPCGAGGWYGIPLAVASWLQSEGVYQPTEACVDLECIDRTATDDEGCSCSLERPRSGAPWLLGLFMFGVFARSVRRKRLASSTKFA